MTPWLLPLQKFDQQKCMWQLEGRDGEVTKAKRCQVWGCYNKDLPFCNISHLGKRLRLKVQASNSGSVCLNDCRMFIQIPWMHQGVRAGVRFPWNSIQQFHAFHHFCLTPSSNKHRFVATFRVSCWGSCLPTGHGRQLPRFQLKRIHFFQFKRGPLLILFWTLTGCRQFPIQVSSQTFLSMHVHDLGAFVLRVFIGPNQPAHDKQPRVCPYCITKQYIIQNLPIFINMAKLPYF